MQITIRRTTLDDAEAISAVWEVVCAERIYTAVNRPFTPQQERDYIVSLSDREGIFLAEVDGRVVGFQSLDLWAKYTDSFDHVGVLGTILLPLLLVASLYGMNVSLPFEGSSLAFTFIILISLAISGGMLAYFRLKRWI